MAAATASVTLPAPLQALADLSSHRARTQRVLDDLVPVDAGERYDEGVDAECPETYEEPERTQSPFRNFCDWCKAHCAQLQPFSNNWELAAETAPEDSLWRKRVEAYRDLLWKTKPGKPFAEFCSTRDSVMESSVFWPWVARTWRTAPQEVKDAFVAAAAVRGITVAVTWVEHIWDVDHPQSQEIRSGSIKPVNASINETTFGCTRLMGPLDPEHPIHAMAKPFQLPLAGWKVPLMFKSAPTGTCPQLYAYDRFDNVYFRIWLHDDNFGPLTSLLEPIHPTPVKLQVRRQPALPAPRRFHSDLLDSVAASYASRTNFETIVDAIQHLRREGYIHTEDDEVAFITEYRAHCRQD